MDEWSCKMHYTDYKSRNNLNYSKCENRASLKEDDLYNGHFKGRRESHGKIKYLYMTKLF